MLSTMPGATGSMRSWLQHLHRLCMSPLRSFSKWSNRRNRVCAKRLDSGLRHRYNRDGVTDRIEYLESVSILTVFPG